MYWTNGDYIPPRRQQHTGQHIVRKTRCALAVALLATLTACASAPRATSLASIPSAEPTHAGFANTSASERARAATTSSQLRQESDGLWARMRQDFEIDVPATPEVAAQSRWIQENRSHLKRVTEQAAPYLFYIVEAADQRDLPVELALLPLMESSYNPFAGRSEGPHGLWQIIPGTARSMGLRQTKQYDERRDIEASTQAALDMLGNLNKRYDGDWLLTLAAYNRGAQAVDNAIASNRAKGKATDFWSLSMPSHTRQYVARFLALADTVADPERYGVSLAQIENAPYFARVPLRQGIVLKDAAKLAQVDLSEIKRLNPGASSRSPLSASHLLVPVDRADEFSQALQGYDFSKSRLAVAAQEADSAATGSAELKSHKVRPGETLQRIAKRYEMSARSLARLNKLAADAKLQPGQKIKVPAQAGKAASEKRKKIAYTVRKGDSLAAIASRFDVDVADIKRWNANSTGKLKPGQQLTLWLPPKGTRAIN